MKIIYECEFCKKQSVNKQQIIDCEKSHNLPDDITKQKEIIKQWNYLKNKAQHVSKYADIVKNNKINEDYSRAIKELVDFEIKYNLNNNTKKDI